MTTKRRVLATGLLTVMWLAGCSSPPRQNADPKAKATSTSDPLRDPRESHLADVVQLTRGQGENAEAYWSFDGSQLIFQSARPPYECDQIFRVPADGSAPPELVSTGKGRTTCAYFLPGDDRVVYSSTHLGGDSCPPPPDHSQGYVWALYGSYDIFSSKPDGSDLVALTDHSGYDAEATVCPVDGSIIFTSTRDGDLELYRMDRDGNNVRRLTNAPGYDGGAFFSQDCSMIVWRASRPQGDALADYQRLLKQGLVRPSKLELWVARADGSDARQVTYLNAASFAPYFHPSGRRILFSSNHGDPKGREFDIWAIDIDGTNLERITFSPGFDGFPMFSPDGSKLAFASNRNQAVDGETDVYVARWVENVDQKVVVPSHADRYMADVRWLSDDKRDGRGLGTGGLQQSAMWLAKTFKDIGLQGGMGNKNQLGNEYLQALWVPTKLTPAPGTRLIIDGKSVAKTAFVPAPFSSRTDASGPTVVAGWGISAPDLGHDDFGKRRFDGKVVVVRRDVPDKPAFSDRRVSRRHSDLRKKAFEAKRRGAVALIAVDAPVKRRGQQLPPPMGLPAMDASKLGDQGIPIVVVDRAAGAALFRGRHKVDISIDLTIRKSSASNVVAVVRAGHPDKKQGAVVVGAHYDHLGQGGHGSRALGVKAVHNGADDNASGTAALLEVARQLHESRAELTRDVYLVAFTAEERGLLGSKHFVANPPDDLPMTDVVAMINMDMVGRLRDNHVAVMGTKTAREWPSIVEPACQRARLGCKMGGDGYGPSDQTSFSLAKIPVLYLFSGQHSEYHTPCDDHRHINAAGGARIALLVADLAKSAANHDGRLSYVDAPAAEPGAGDTRARSFKVTLGVMPDYTAKQPGLTLAGVRPGRPAANGGLKAGDRIIKMGKTEVRSVEDYMYLLSEHQPGDKVKVRFVRDGAEKTTTIVFDKSKRPKPGAHGKPGKKSPHGGADPNKAMQIKCTEHPLGSKQLLMGHGQAAGH